MSQDNHEVGGESSSPEELPQYRSHLRPRTSAGRIAVGLFLALFALTQPPIVHALAARVDIWILGLPFLYIYLLGLYGALILVLIWAYGRRI
jgi:hypothetical protein